MRKMKKYIIGWTKVKIKKWENDSKKTKQNDERKKMS